MPRAPGGGDGEEDVPAILPGGREAKLGRTALAADGLGDVDVAGPALGLDQVGLGLLPRQNPGRGVRVKLPKVFEIGVSVVGADVGSGHQLADGGMTPRVRMHLPGGMHGTKFLQQRHGVVNAWSHILGEFVPQLPAQHCRMIVEGLHVLGNHSISLRFAQYHLDAQLVSDVESFQRIGLVPVFGSQPGIQGRVCSVLGDLLDPRRRAERVPADGEKW